MNIDKNEITTILAQFNPWWANSDALDIPKWRRAAFKELFNWVCTPPTNRATLLSGARQVGKTTLLRQVIAELIKKGVSPSDILYVTFDHPIINLAGIDNVLNAWREREPKTGSTEYVFLDEAQFIKDWGTWIKHQVDFNKNRRIVFTGSAMPLVGKQESGVGRWHSIRLTTLSFYEYAKLKLKPPTLEELGENGMWRLFMRDQSFAKEQQEMLDKLQQKRKEMFPELPVLKSLRDLFKWSEQKFAQITELAAPWQGHFHDYLMRGGFPQTIQIANINEAQRLLREDIIDKVLKRDMTAIFGVRRVLDLERVFLYLCLHEGGLLDLIQLTSNLGVQRPTAEKFIELFEAAHLIYRLQSFGYGKGVLRAKYKIYLADSAIASSVLLKGKGLLDDATKLGSAVEAAVFKHLLTLGYQHGIRFSYWQNAKQEEVDVIAEKGEQIIPFEIKYQSDKISAKDVKGLIKLCNEKSIESAYIITKSLNDFGLLNAPEAPNTSIMKIPAALFCYWLGHVELTQNDLLK